MKKKLVLAAFAAALTAAPAPAIVLTFEGLASSDFALVPDGYGGFDWDNFAAVNVAQYSPASLAGSGFDNGRVSGDGVVFNGAGGSALLLSSSNAFSLDDGYFTGAWNNGLSITVEGFAGGIAPLFTSTFTVNSDAPTLRTFGWTGLSSVRFTSFGGTDGNPLDNRRGTQFVLDNLRLNETVRVPEPGTWAMMLFGFGAIGHALRRRRLLRSHHSSDAAVGAIACN